MINNDGMNKEQAKEIESKNASSPYHHQRLNAGSYSD